MILYCYSSIQFSTPSVCQQHNCLTCVVLLQYLFDEGRIVELNNQAKHAVSNNMHNKHRVHLIFDYIEKAPCDFRSNTIDLTSNSDAADLTEFYRPYQTLTRHQLEPNETVFQTRRSIDLPKEMGRRKAPSFIIIGAQKCGTTSMYEYLCQHPLVLKGKRRETHYFDWRYNHNIGDDKAEEHYNYYMNFYQLPVLKKHSSLMTGESTPSYLLHA